MSLVSTHTTVWILVLSASKLLTNASNGQDFAVTFCAKTRTKAAIKTLRVEAGVIFQQLRLTNEKFIIKSKCT